MNRGDLEKEVAEVHKKLGELERQQEKMRQKRNDNSSTQHLDELIMLMDRKTQTVLSEVKRIISRMNEGLDKKFETKAVRLQETSNAVSLKNKYEESLRDTQNHFELKLQETQQQHTQQEEMLLKKIVLLEAKLKEIIHVQRQKEKELINWVHHLELQLEQNSMKSSVPKRGFVDDGSTTILEGMSQTDPQKIQTGNSRNITMNNSQKVGNCSVENRTSVTQEGINRENKSELQSSSKVSRKMKIFSKERSISPIRQKIQTPPKENVKQLDLNDLPSSNAQWILDPHVLSPVCPIKESSRAPTSYKNASDFGWDQMQELNHNSDSDDEFFYPNQPNAERCEKVFDPPYLDRNNSNLNNGDLGCTHLIDNIQNNGNIKHNPSQENYSHRIVENRNIHFNNNLKNEIHFNKFPNQFVNGTNGTNQYANGQNYLSLTQVVSPTANFISFPEENVNSKQMQGFHGSLKHDAVLSPFDMNS